MPHLLIAEFPAAVLIGLLALLALKPDREAPEDAARLLGRRHLQVIRDLPDPEAERVRAPVAEWLDRGTGRDEAVGALANAFAPHREEAPALAARIEAALPVRERSRSRRERALRQLLDELRPSRTSPSSRSPGV